MGVLNRTKTIALICLGLFIAANIFCGYLLAADTDTGIQNQLEKLEKEGFGITAVTNDKTGVGTSDKGVGLVRTLSEKSQVSALSFLAFPARGIWSGQEVDKAYNAFIKNVDLHDKDAPAFHFIEAAYAFGRKNYTYALYELNLGYMQDQGCVPMLRLRALVCYKSGDMTTAKKNWLLADHLISGTNGSPGTADWVNAVVFKMKNNWADLINAQKNGNPVHPTVIIIVTIDKDGKVLEAKITHSSGDANLDKLAESACLNSSPVEPPPTTLAIPVRLKLDFDKIRH